MVGNVLQLICFKVIPHEEDLGSILGRNRPKPLKQLVTAVTAKRSVIGASVTGPRR